MSQRPGFNAVLLRDLEVSGCLLLAASAGAQVGSRGNLDAVFANRIETDRVCLGDGAGGFGCRDVSSETPYTSGVALGFLDRDRNLDIVFSNRVCLGDGHGSFACSELSETPCPGGLSVALGFVDGDENLDAVFSSDVCFGNGAGGFTHSEPIASVPPPYGGESRVALGFVDGDKNLDAVFANSAFLQPKPPDRVCLGDGAGDFACSNVDTNQYDHSYDVALGYLDGDDNLDAVFANGGQSQVCHGNGHGDFSCSFSVNNGSYPTAVALGFIDGDEKLDAVFSGHDGSHVCLGDGFGSFACFNLDQVPSSDVALGYIDGDGKLDAVFAGGPWSAQRNRVCFGDGAGGFTCSDVSTDMNFTLGVALGDVDSPLIFADGFESGDTSAWSATVP